jgi:serine/threonine protein kinase
MEEFLNTLCILDNPQAHVVTVAAPAAPALKAKASAQPKRKQESSAAARTQKQKRKKQKKQDKTDKKKCASNPHLNMSQTGIEIAMQYWRSVPEIPQGVWAVLQEKHQTVGIESAASPRRIGNGTFGQVFAGMQNQTPVAVKIRIGATRHRRSLWIEPLLMSAIDYHARLLCGQHSHIVEFVGWDFVTEANQRLYDLPQRFFGAPTCLQTLAGNQPRLLLTQRHDCDLGAWIEARGDVSAKERAATTTRVMGHLLRGLVFLHSIGIQHRDLKPQNILVSESSTTGEATFRIADLGSSGAYFGGNRHGKTRADLVEPTGWQQTSLRFRAPEMVAGYVHEQLMAANSGLTCARFARLTCARSRELGDHISELGPHMCDECDTFAGLTYEGGTMLDIWSAGVIGIELLTGKDGWFDSFSPPRCLCDEQDLFLAQDQVLGVWFDECYAAVREIVRAGATTPHRDFWRVRRELARRVWAAARDSAPGLTTLIERMLKGNPTHRLSAREALVALDPESGSTYVTDVVTALTSGGCSYVEPFVLSPSRRGRSDDGESLFSVRAPSDTKQQSWGCQFCPIDLT